MELPNLSYIDALSGGDNAFKTKLITILKQEFPEEKETYFRNFKGQKFIAAAENVHKIKHKISILGLEKSYKIAEEFENNLKGHDSSGHEAFSAILQNISNYLKTL